MYVFYKQENHLTKYLHDIQYVPVIETQYGLVVKTAGSSFRLDSNNPISSCVILGNCLTSLYLFSHSYIYIYKQYLPHRSVVRIKECTYNSGTQHVCTE